MPFDSAPPAEVTARDRVIQLRDFLDRLPDERFDMGSWGIVDHAHHNCKTAACVKGWAEALFASTPMSMSMVGDLLGMDEAQSANLFQHVRSCQGAVALLGLEGLYDIKPHHAVAVLDHYLAEGVIDWRAAK